jgi:Spy/CpxP family protein refolding chaperone
MSDRPIPTAPQPPRALSRRRRMMIAAVTGTAVLAGAFGVAHAWEANHRWSMRDGIPVQLVEHRVDHVLDKADATADQKSRVNAIIEAAARDIDPLRLQIAGSRDQAVALLEAPKIDRAAIEQLRVQRVATMDKITQRLTAAIADAADVLTPEQRQKLGHDLAEMRQQHEPD